MSGAPIKPRASGPLADHSLLSTADYAMDYDIMDYIMCYPMPSHKTLKPSTQVFGGVRMEDESDESDIRDMSFCSYVSTLID